MRKIATILVSFVVALSVLLPSIPVYARDPYRTRSQIVEAFLTLETAYPTLLSHEIIGYSVEMNEIYLFKVGNADGGQVLIDASIHGNEHASTETLYYVVEWLLTSMEEDAQRILENNCVLVIPVVNVDRYGTSRYNAHGVDLNRNYETGWGLFNDYARGEYFLSEPETQAIHNVFLSYDVTWYLDLHTGDYRISPPWAYQTGVPDELIHQQVYDNYVTISDQRVESTIPYTISGNYAGGTARDEGYAGGGAYTYCVELQNELKPGIHVVRERMVPKLISLTIAICQASETVSPDTEPPLISAIGASDITDSHATINWLTNELSNSVVFYGPTLPLGTTASDLTLVTDHSLILAELSEATKYYYEVQSTDASGNIAVDNNGGAYYTFTTLTPDTSPPEILDATGNTVGTTGESVTIIGTIIDNVGVAEANVYYTPIDGMETTIPMAKAESNNLWSAEIPVAVDKVGTVTYYMTAQDLEENIARDPAIGTYNITVDDNDAPVAEAGPNQTVEVKKVVYFDGTSSTDNIGITVSTWDFDSSNGIQEDASGMTASHVYSVEGTYIVTFTVRDEAGNSDVDTLEVNVTEFQAQPTANLTIAMSREENNRGQSRWSRVTAIVTVLVEGTPLKEATVYGYWSGAHEEPVTGKTTGKGEIAFRTQWVKQAGTFTFTVTSVKKDGINYVLTGETSLSI